MADPFTFTIDRDRLGKDITRVMDKLESSVKPMVFFGALREAGWKVASWASKYRFAGVGTRKGEYGTKAHSKKTLSDILTSRTGLLARSIVSWTERQQVEQNGNVYTMKVGSPVVYARIHEYGGSIIHYPRSSRLMLERKRSGAFKKISKAGAKVGIGFSFGKNAKGGFSSWTVHIPARPYLRPALEDKGNQKMIVNTIAKYIRLALNQGSEK